MLFLCDSVTLWLIQKEGLSNKEVAEVDIFDNGVLSILADLGKLNPHPLRCGEKLGEFLLRIEVPDDPPLHAEGVVDIADGKVEPQDVIRREHLFPHDKSAPLADDVDMARIVHVVMKIADTFANGGPRVTPPGDGEDAGDYFQQVFLVNRLLHIGFAAGSTAEINVLLPMRSGNHNYAGIL